MSGEEPTSGTQDFRPLWLRQQAEDRKQSGVNQTAWAQAVDAKDRGGEYAGSGAPTIPENSGTGLSPLVVGAETHTLQPKVLNSTETSQGEAELQKLRMEEKARKEEGIKGARARFKLIMDSANRNLYHAVIIIIATGLFVAYKLLGQK